MRDLSDLEEHITPPGCRIRSVDSADTEDVFARAKCTDAPGRRHASRGLLGLEITGNEPGSSYSTAKHRALMDTPAYRPQLDLVAVAPDGIVVAYALGWLDEQSHSLLFEPVGTDPAHSGRGLARALCAQMLRAARQLGAKEAVVGPRGDAGYPLPRRVYEGPGMHEVVQFVPMTNS